MNLRDLFFTFLVIIFTREPYLAFGQKDTLHGQEAQRECARLLPEMDGGSGSETYRSNKWGLENIGWTFFINTSCFIIIYFTAAAFKSGKMTVPGMPGMPPGMRMPGFPGMPPPMSKNHFYIYLRALNRLDVTSHVLTLELVTIVNFYISMFSYKDKRRFDIIRS